MNQLKGLTIKIFFCTWSGLSSQTRSIHGSDQSTHLYESCYFIIHNFSISKKIFVSNYTTIQVLPELALLVLSDTHHTLHAHNLCTISTDETKISLDYGYSNGKTTIVWIGYHSIRHVQKSPRLKEKHNVEVAKCEARNTKKSSSPISCCGWFVLSNSINLVN